MKLVWNALEVRQHIAWRFGAVAFVDVGNVFEKAENVSLMNMRVTPGAGIRIASPVGLLRFDVGWNPYSERDEDHLAYHLSVGHAF